MFASERLVVTVSLRCAPARWRHGWGRFPVHRPRPPHRQGSTCSSKDIEKNRARFVRFVCPGPVCGPVLSHGFFSWNHSGHSAAIRKVEVFRQRSLPPKLIPILSCQVTASEEWKIQKPHPAETFNNYALNKAFSRIITCHWNGKRTRIINLKRSHAYPFVSTIGHTSRWPSTIAAPCSRIYLRTWLCLPSSNFNLFQSSLSHWSSWGFIPLGNLTYGPYFVHLSTGL